MDYRKDLYERFGGLFGGESEDIEPGDEKTNGRRLSFEDKQAEQQEERQRKWMWISIIYQLCDGDITKTEMVINKTFTECLVWLSYKKEMNI